MSNKYIMLTLHDDDVSMFSFSEGKVKIKKITKTAYDEYGNPLVLATDSHYNITARKLKLADVESDELKHIIEELDHELKTRTRRENELHEK